MPKEVAFGGPEWMWGAGPLWDPTHALSNDERYLRAVYNFYRRDDLARCVDEARIHQRLNCFIGGGLGYKESRLHQLRCIESLLHEQTVEQVQQDQEAWTEEAMERHLLDPDLSHVIRLESLKITGRQPQLRYQYFANSTLLAILEGVSLIRDGIQGAFEALKFWGGGAITLV
jgi:hypothetical protein